MDTVSARPYGEGLTTFEPGVAAPPVADAPAQTTPWPLWQRVAFRYFFVYLLTQIEPWDWFRIIPGLSWLLKPYDELKAWATRAANAHIFHVRETLVPMNGSGDTSFAWAQLWMLLSFAAVACVVWSVLDRKRPHYERLAFWLRQSVRYYVAAAALSYGIIKLFLLQMVFPSLSQLATPLGDLLPMRFSWLFIGYSDQYQFFSGAMETIAGLLLLYRRTITAGLFAATGAFVNVVMINLAYDVPVKLYASHLLFSCLFLLALDSKRLVGFLVLNKGAPPTTAWDFDLTKKWQVWGVRFAKAFMVYQLLVMVLINTYTRYQNAHRPPPPGPFAVGMYDVQRYIVNRDTIPLSSTDTLRWKDVIFDGPSAGSINTLDATFQRRYHRGYFRFKPDPKTHDLVVWKTSTIPGDSTFLFTMRYEKPDSNTIRLHTVIRGDSVHVELARMERHFQLTERQFHWLSEYNR